MRGKERREFECLKNKGDGWIAEEGKRSKGEKTAEKDEKTEVVKAPK